MARAPKHGESLTVMLADLDRFKTVNDQFGHAVGDRVLQIFANTITRALRASDMSGRLGGEEFAFLMPRTNPQTRGVSRSAYAFSLPKRRARSAVTRSTPP